VVDVGQGPLKPRETIWTKNLSAFISLRKKPIRNHLGQRKYQGKRRHLDDIDRAIINEIQSDFPVTQRPYRELGKRFDLKEHEIIERVERLKSEGIIRRIGGNFNSKRLNFTSTLCAAKVSEEKMDRFVQVVNSYSGVTHNYLRNHEYNVWFTFIAPNMSYIDQTLSEVSEATGVTEIRNLPAIKVFKIKVDFEI
jgi:DNA-binding Lrp family transcriptional regulator